MKRTHDDFEADEQAAHESESDDGDEEDLDVPPYDARSEQLPASPVYTTAFETLNKSISDLVKLLVKPLEQSEYQDAVVQGLLKDVQDRTISEAPEHIKVALVGDMQSGRLSATGCTICADLVQGKVRSSIPS